MTDTGADPLGLVETTVEPGIVRWTIDNPARRNAIGPRALQFIARRCAALSGEVVILGGAGDEAFCAGFDLTALDEIDPAGPPDAPLIAATAAMAEADATFIAAIGGYAIGAGVELACACDTRLAREGVTFRVPAAELGVVYHAAGLARIHHAFGPGLTQRLLLLAHPVRAEEALAAGALCEVTAAGEVDARALGIAQHLRSTAPLSLRAHRRMLRTMAVGGPSAADLQAHLQARLAAYQSEDHGEARAARAQKRDPRFRGH